MWQDLHKLLNSQRMNEVDLRTAKRILAFFTDFITFSKQSRTVKETTKAPSDVEKEAPKENTLGYYNNTRIH